MREWVARVRLRSANAEEFVEAVAQVTLDGGGFLKPTRVEMPSSIDASLSQKHG